MHYAPGCAVPAHLSACPLPAPCVPVACLHISWGGSHRDASAPALLPAEDAAALAAAAGVAAAPARKRKHPAADDGSGSSSEGEDGEDDGEEEGSDEEGSEEEGDEGTPEDLVFPAEFAPALVQLLDSAADAPGGGGAPLPVATIALPDPELQLQVGGQVVALCAAFCAVPLWRNLPCCTVPRRAVGGGHQAS